MKEVPGFFLCGLKGSRGERVVLTSKKKPPVFRNPSAGRQTEHSPTLILISLISLVWGSVLIQMGQAGKYEPYSLCQERAGKKKKKTARSCVFDWCGLGNLRARRIGAWAAPPLWKNIPTGSSSLFSLFLSARDFPPGIYRRIYAFNKKDKQNVFISDAKIVLGQKKPLNLKLTFVTLTLIEHADAIFFLLQMETCNNERLFLLRQHRKVHILLHYCFFVHLH